MAQFITTLNDIRELMQQGWTPSLSDIIYVCHGSGSYRDRAFTLEEIRNLLQGVFSEISIEGQHGSMSLNAGAMSFNHEDGEQYVKVSFVDGLKIDKDDDKGATVNEGGVKSCDGSRLFDVDLDAAKEWLKFEELAQNGCKFKLDLKNRLLTLTMTDGDTYGTSLGLGTLESGKVANGSGYRQKVYLNKMFKFENTASQGQAENWKLVEVPMPGAISVITESSGGPGENMYTIRETVIAPEFIRFYEGGEYVYQGNNLYYWRISKEVSLSQDEAMLTATGDWNTSDHWKLWQTRKVKNESSTDIQVTVYPGDAMTKTVTIPGYSYREFTCVGFNGEPRHGECLAYLMPCGG